MSDIKLFRTENGQVDQLEGRSPVLVYQDELFVGGVFAEEVVLSRPQRAVATNS